MVAVAAVGMIIFFGRCLSCGHEEERTHFQTRLIDANHHWVSSLDLTPPLDNTELEEQTTGIRPDGDANVSSDYSNFQVPSCMACQKGIMVLLSNSLIHDILTALFPLETHCCILW